MYIFAKHTVFKTPVKSDRTIYFSFRYLPFVLGLFFIIIPIIAHLNPENSTFNGEPGPPDSWTTALFVLIGILIGLVPFLYKDKLVVVELDNQNIRILKDEEVIEVSWLDIKTINLLPAIFPPVYKLTLVDSDDYYLFNTTRWGINFLIFTWDWSEMGALIRKKKKELGI